MEFPLDEVGEEQAIAALLAVIRGDDEEARRVLGEEMTAPERETLGRHLDRLAVLTAGTAPGPSWRGIAHDGEALIVNLCELSVSTLLEFRRRLRWPGVMGRR